MKYGKCYDSRKSQTYCCTACQEVWTLPYPIETPTRCRCCLKAFWPISSSRRDDPERALQLQLHHQNPKLHKHPDKLF